jgi:hypothetical protein
MVNRRTDYLWTGTGGDARSQSSLGFLQVQTFDDPVRSSSGICLRALTFSLFADE